eukprot:SAG31_NODE_1841_length_7117_cov_12.976207_5_plen_120_part_00
MCVCGWCGVDVKGADGMLMPEANSDEWWRLLNWLGVQFDADRNSSRSYGRLMSSTSIRVSRSQHFTPDQLTPVKRGPKSREGVLTLRHGDEDTQSRPIECVLDEMPTKFKPPGVGVYPI